MGQIAGYQIDGLLGRGATGETYRAEDRDGHQVVLKLVTEALSAGDGFRERFLRDVDRLVSLEHEHEHVVGIHEVGEAGGRLFVVADRVEGKDLEELLAREGPLPAERAMRLVEQAASGLHAARWGRGIVHGNLKPSNILVGEAAGTDAADCVYLVDFGLWRAGAAGSRGASLPHEPGPIEYLAPERVRGAEPTSRSDQYALGSVLSECLTGAPPLRARSIGGSRASEPEAHPTGPPSWAMPRAELPAGLDQVIARALAERPEERYPSVLDFVVAARAALAAGVQRMEPGDPRGPRQRPHATPAKPVHDEPRPRKAASEPDPRAVTNSARRRWRPVVIGALLGLAAVAAGVALVARGGDGSEQAGASAPIEAASPAEPQIRQQPTQAGPASPENEAAASVDGEDRDSADEPAASQRLAPGSVARIDPETGRFDAIDTGLGDARLSVVVGEGMVWAFERDGVGRVVQIDPKTNAVARTVDIVGRPRAIAIGEGSVWVASSLRGDGILVEIAADTGRFRRAVNLGYSGVMAAALGEGSLWVAAAGAQGNLVLRIEPASGRVVAAIPISNRPFDVAVGDGVVGG